MKTKDNNAYFQGTEEPYPKKKKYQWKRIKWPCDDAKDAEDKEMEETPLVFYRNFDAYNDKGEDIEATKGSGKKLHEITSVHDFRKRKKRMEKRKKAYLQISYLHTAASIDSNNLFDPYEDQGVTPLPFAPAEPGGGISGMLDGITPKEDVDGKSPYNLYYGVLETHFADDAEKKDEEDFEEEDLAKAAGIETHFHMRYKDLYKQVLQFEKLAQEGMFEGIRRNQLEQPDPEEEVLEPWDDPMTTPLDEGNEPAMSHGKAIEEIKLRLGDFAVKEFVKHFGELDYYDPKDVAYFIHYYWLEFD